MINFLKETKQAITDNGYRVDQIDFIGSGDYFFGITTWSKFETLANFEYDNQSGNIVIPVDLIIEFDNRNKLVRKQSIDNNIETESWEYVERYREAIRFRYIDTLQAKECSTVLDLHRDKLIKSWGHDPATFDQDVLTNHIKQVSKRRREQMLYECA
jgi:hypothetical protein